MKLKDCDLLIDESPKLRKKSSDYIILEDEKCKEILLEKSDNLLNFNS